MTADKLNAMLAIGSSLGILAKNETEATTSRNSRKKKKKPTNTKNKAVNASEPIPVICQLLNIRHSC